MCRRDDDDQRIYLVDLRFITTHKSSLIDFFPYTYFFSCYSNVFYIRIHIRNNFLSVSVKYLFRIYVNILYFFHLYSRIRSYFFIFYSAHIPFVYWFKIFFNLGPYKKSTFFNNFVSYFTNYTIPIARIYKLN